MSIYGLAGYEQYRIKDPQPAWVKNERYEYCEPYERTSLSSRIPFVQFLISLL